MKIIIAFICLGISFSACSQNMNTGNLDSLNTGDTTIYEVVDTAAHFPGGRTAWNKFIGETLNPTAPLEKSAKTGTYRVIIKFTVLKDGTLKDFQPETKYGHGFEEETIRTFKLSPKWIAAIKNGVQVNSTIKQTQVFVITAG
jgi:hypothetical protein